MEDRNGNVEAEERRKKRQARTENLKRKWYQFSRNKMSVVGLVIVVLIILAAVFQSLIAPYPQHAKEYVDFANANKAPCAQFLLGTDAYGRDVLSRIISVSYTHLKR